MGPIRAVDHPNVQFIVVLQWLHGEVSRNVVWMSLLVYQLHFEVFCFKVFLCYWPEYFEILKAEINITNTPKKLKKKKTLWVNIRLSFDSNLSSKLNAENWRRKFGNIVEELRHHILSSKMLQNIKKCTHSLFSKKYKIIH